MLVKGAHSPINPMSTTYTMWLNDIYIGRKKDNILTALPLSSLNTSSFITINMSCCIQIRIPLQCKSIGKNQCICSIGSIWMYICVSGSAKSSYHGAVTRVWSWFRWFVMATHLRIHIFRELSGMKSHHKTALGIMLCSFADHVRYQLVFENDTDTNWCLAPILKGTMAKSNGNSCLGFIFQKHSLEYRRQIKPGQFCIAIHLTIWAVQNGPAMLNRNKTGLAFIFWTGLDQVLWKLMLRTYFQKHSLEYRRQIKPGQFCIAIHLTIRAVQNGPGMLNRNKTGLALIFWTGLDQVRWKLVFRTDFEKHSLDYRRQLKPGRFCTTLLCRMVRPCTWVIGRPIAREVREVPRLSLFTKWLQWRHNGRDGVSITSLTIVYSTVYSGAD